MKIVILGAGTSGWYTATAIKNTCPDIDVVLVHDPKTTTIGVGETIGFMSVNFIRNILGLKYQRDWMTRTDAVFKLGINYWNWTHPGSNHYGTKVDEQVCSRSLLEGADCLAGSDATLFQIWRDMYANGELDNEVWDLNPTTPFAKLEKSIITADGKFLTNEFDSYSYHYNAEKVGPIVRELRGLPIGVIEIEGRVQETMFHENGDIKELVLDNGKHVNGDLFFDCSGFARVLVKQIEEFAWTPSDEYTNNSVIFRQIMYSDYSDHPNSGHKVSNTTHFTGMNHGWRFTIPLSHRTGNGYVFNNRITPDIDQLADEFNAMSGPVQDGQSDFRMIKWNPGTLSQPSARNCIPMGLSAFFTDPLDANNLNCTLNLLTFLTKKLKQNKDFKSWQKEYNQLGKHLLDNIRLRVELGLRTTGRTDTEYWREMKHRAEETHLVERVEQYLLDHCEKPDHMGYPVSLIYGIALRHNLPIRIPGVKVDPALRQIFKTWLQYQQEKNTILANSSIGVAEFYKKFYSDEFNPDNSSVL